MLPIHRRPHASHRGRARRPGPASVAAVLLLGAAAGAQDTELEALGRRVEALERGHAEELEAMREELDAALTQLEAARSERATSQNASIFNPAITVSGLFNARTDDRPAYEYDDPGEVRIDDQFSLREAELDLRAPVGPWSDGVLIVEIEEDGDEYVILRRLPLLDIAPGGLQLKIGQFRASINRQNRIHPHNLPQPTYARSFQQFLGHHGYIRTGVSGQFFLPSPSESISLQATVEVLNGGDLPPESIAGRSEISTLGQLRSFAELSSANTFDLGATAWTDGSERSLYGADFAYEWLPPGRATWNSFLVAGEFFQGDFDQPGLEDAPIGYNVFVQYQFNASNYLGVRYDHSQELEDTELETDIFGVYATHYASEFLRFRLGYEHAASDLDLIDGRDTGFLEVNFIYGSHPADPHWVHR